MSGGLNADSTILRRSPRDRPARSTLPPGPGMPSTLQALGWLNRPMPFMERCRARYGDTFTLDMRHFGRWVFLCDPDDVKKVFTADTATVGVDIANPLLGPILGSRSVMLLDEPEHLRRRKLLLPYFRGRHLQHGGEASVEAARRAVAEWPRDEPFELWPRMQAITQDVILRSVFGDGDPALRRRVDTLLNVLTEWAGHPHRSTVLTAFGPRWVARSPAFRAAMAPIEQAVLAEVRRRRGGDDPGEGIISMLAHVQDDDGSLLDDQTLRDELVTLLTDGPTSASLAWMFERVLRHPEALDRLTEEVEAGGVDHYARAVVNETLRLCAPVPVVVRRLLQPMRLGGHLLPAGTTVAPCIYLIHRDPDIYPEPERFRPERFLDRPPGTYTWIPFGGGVRRCLAADFAGREMREVMRTVIATTELHAVDPKSEGAVRSAISFGPGARSLVTAHPRRTPLALDPTSDPVPVL
ncbi:MAG: cytochrome P450 [Patulibacter sp.]